MYIFRVLGSGGPACPPQELTCPGQADRGFVAPCGVLIGMTGWVIFLISLVYYVFCRLTVLFWLWLLALGNLKLEFPRMVKLGNMHYWLSLWVWSSSLSVSTRWTALSHLIVRLDSMRSPRKCLHTSRKLATIPKQWHLCLSLGGTETTCWKKVKR